MAMIIEVVNSGFGVVGLLLLVLASCAITYWLGRRSVDQKLRRIEHQLASVAEMKSTVDALVDRKPEPVALTEPPKPARPKPAVAAPASEPAREEGLPHETLVVIAAAVAAFLGKSVRLRSARLIQPLPDSAWAQQGRVYVQASHNLGHLAH